MRALPARTGVALGVCAGMTLAAAAWPASRPATRTYTTGQFVVNCTSTGEVCSPPERLKLKPPRPGTITSVLYTTAPTHCSALALQVVRGRRVLATSAPIAAGRQTARFATSIAVPKGPSQIGFRAKGFRGGCNAGRVVSWGGDVTVTVRLHS